MRIIALLATYNEQRFIRNCLDNLLGQGLEVYLIDNQSTDATRAIAGEYLGRGLIDIETFPRDGMYRWRPLLQRKAQLAREIDADWFMHVDADEIRLPPAGHDSLKTALEAADAAGCNAVNFQEFTFTPVAESPDHDHPDYLRTMRWYYPFLPAHPHRLNAWKKHEQADLAASGGHKVRFPGLRMYPTDFVMKHYLFLSIPHAVEKYAHKLYDPAEVAAGWHGARARLTADPRLTLPACRQLRSVDEGGALDARNPRTRHFLFERF